MKPVASMKASTPQLEPQCDRLQKRIIELKTMMMKEVCSKLDY